MLDLPRTQALCSHALDRVRNMLSQGAQLSLGMVLAWTIVGVGMVGIFLGPAQASLTDSPQGNLEVTREGERGPVTFSLPLYQKDGIKYFSSGVGLEERQAQYPPYPLKLVFAMEKGSFLSSVTVTIQHQDGSQVLEVPAEQVRGPWLFVDLPSGEYQLTATRQNGEKVKRDVIVSEKGTRVVHFHWSSM